MSESSSTLAPPTSMPVLSRGRHRNPARGACFMEFTALLAGEQFSDRPACVDPALAAVLRGANDTLSDEDRPALVPLLGRAIGLAVAPPDGEDGRAGRFRLAPSRTGRDRSAALTARLHVAVCARFRAAVGAPTSAPGNGWYLRRAGVGQTFWDLMSEPSIARTSREYSVRLVERLELLHACYEDAFAAMGLPVRTTSEPAAAASVPESAVLASPAA